MIVAIAIDGQAVDAVDRSSSVALGEDKIDSIPDLELLDDGAEASK